MAMNAREWLLLCLLSLFWGTSFFFHEVALRELPPFTVVLARVGIAAVVLHMVNAMAGVGLPRGAAVWGAFLVMGAVNNALPFSLIVLGQTQIDSGLAAILNGTTPMFSLVLAAFVTRTEPLTWNRVGGLVLGLVGVVVLVGPAALQGLGLREVGQFAVLAAALCYACAALFGRRFRSMAPSVVAAGQVSCAALLMAPVVLLVDRPWTLSPGGTTWGAVLGLAILGTAIAYPLYFRLLASAGATNLMLVTLLNPVTALVLGMAVLGEQPAVTAFAGMLLIFAGLAVMDGRVLRALRLRAQGSAAR